MRLLLVEPYATGSHQAWAEGYAGHSGHTVDLLALPGRFWKWRMQGATLTLAEAAARLPMRPDVVLASDMLHLPAFLGLTRHHLGRVPVVLYLHENQLTYPWPPGEKPDLTYAMTNWLSMAAADQVWFNSSFHLESFFSALPSLLSHFPDEPHGHLIDAVRSRACVVPVGIDLRRFDRVPRLDAPQAPGTIIWNQRWEYDKDPGTFFAALDAVAAAGHDFRVILAGESFRQQPEEFDAALARLGPRVTHAGHVAEADYPAVVRKADVVVSTARHEFFGVAAIEAAYAGALPVLPRRLSYPELVAAAFLYDTFDELVDRVAGAVSDPAAARAEAAPLHDALARFDWSVVAPDYDARLAGLGSGRTIRP